MSAPTPAPGDESPREGYYPDPSIPGYVRYWNGASWVPGTSRPAPQSGEATPSAPAPEAAAPRQPGPAPVDETGPVFFDEEPQDDGRPEPSHAWQADVSRQNGFGGERDRRVSWGGGQPAQQGGQPGPSPDPRTPAASLPAGDPPVDRSPAVRSSGDRLPAVRPGADLAPVDPRRPVRQDPTGGALPGMRDGAADGAENTVAIRVARHGRAGGGDRDAGSPPVDGTVSIRAAGHGRRPPVPRDAEQQPAEQPPADGTMTMRATGPAVAPAAPQASGPAAPAPSRASAPAPGPARQNPAAQDPARLNGPLTRGPGAAASWAQQTPQQPRPEQAALPQVPAQQQRPAFPQQSQAPQLSQTPHQPQLSQTPHQPQLSQTPHQPQQSQTPHQPQQPHAPQPDQPVVPWKPPVNDHFQQLAAARAAARPAALGKRFAARLIDTAVLATLVGAIAVPLATQAADHINEKIDAARLSGETVTVWLLDSTTAGLTAAVLVAFLVLGVLLEALPTAKWGRTLGKKLCGLDVRDIESGSAPAFGAALRRWLVYGVLGVLVIGVANVLWCLIDRPWRQCWHDKAARTFVAG
ncbi:RDD family protein [Streptomyces sp. ADI92-24]|uniref:RDD family protein n=1 Tax=Streptomyces sp. ADI92-24 TaxID=1522756 RepID=UPI000F550231|nr:RDD family protein [Streptomyces sp. ADI92-24]